MFDSLSVDVPLNSCFERRSFRVKGSQGAGFTAFFSLLILFFCTIELHPATFYIFNDEYKFLAHINNSSNNANKKRK